MCAERYLFTVLQNNLNKRIMTLWRPLALVKVGSYHIETLYSQLPHAFTVDTWDTLIQTSSFGFFQKIM